MSNPVYWWLLAGALVVLELMTGTFYLLMLASGMACAALGAHAGLSMPYQIVVAAVVSGGAVMGWHWKKMRTRNGPSAQANPSTSLDIGETVQVDVWEDDGTASVHYRGARWTAIHRNGITPSPGLHRVAELVGNRLLVDKA